MTEKALFGSVIVFAIAVTASLVIPVWTFETRLVTNPSSKHFSVPAGKPLEITCKGDSRDNKYFSDMKWLNPEGEVLSEGNPGVQKVGTNLLKLTFSAPKTGDSGVYKCVALFDNKQSLQTEVTIAFSGREPTFERDYVNVAAVEGTKVEVLCWATGELPISYVWYNEREDQMPSTSDSPIFVSSAGGESTLNIKAVKITDGGIYTCSASNNFGLASKLFQLTVFPKSDNETDDTLSIQNVHAVKITVNSIVFTILTSESDYSIEVKYSESQNSTEYKKEWKRDEVYEMKDLIPSGLYSFQFRTTPSGGNWSKVYNVTLLPDVPEVIFQSLEGNRVKLEWFRTLDDVMRQTIDKFQLTYNTLQINRGTDWIPNNCVVTIELPSCVGRSYTISGLQHRVYYEIQFRAHTASGFGNPYKQKFYLE